MFCPQCGAELVEGTKFCSQCGAHVEDVMRVDETVRLEQAKDAFASEPTVATEAPTTVRAASQQQAGTHVNDPTVVRETPTIRRPAEHVQAPIPEAQPYVPSAQARLHEVHRRPHRDSDFSGLVGAFAAALAIAIISAIAFFVLRPLMSNNGAVAQDVAEQTEAAEQASDESAASAAEQPEVETGPKAALLTVSQVNTESYPEVVVYLNARDSEGVALANLNASSLALTEVDPAGNAYDTAVASVGSIGVDGSSYTVRYSSACRAKVGSYITVRLALTGSDYEGSVETTYQVLGSPTEQKQEEEQKRTISDGNYILPESDSRTYTAEELSGLSDTELELARNEIFARHGRGFKSQDLQEYFNSKSWYTKRYEPDEYDAIPSQLNSYESANVSLISQIEASR